MKNILVHVDDSDNAVRRVKAAAALAKEHDARINGLFVRPSVDISYLAQTVAGLSLEEALSKAADAQAEKARHLFEQCLEGYPKQRWLVTTGNTAEAVVPYARYCDLMVIGAADTNLPSNLRLSSQVVLGSGLPVLTIPERASVATLGKRVLIAWNASPEAIHAVRNALPILQKAQRVDILSVIAGTTSSPVPDTTLPAEQIPGLALSIQQLPGQHLADYLAEYNISATARPVRHDPINGVAGIILAEAEKSAADLVVMGAFGRSRLREALVGSTTNLLLSRSTIPLFVAH